MSNPVGVCQSLRTAEIQAVIDKKKRSDDEKALLVELLDRSLSDGAKTYLEQWAKEFVYGFYKELDSKQTAKGKQVEDASIELYNSVFFTDHKKNTERRTDDHLTGECDIFTGSEIIDIKSSWSLDTFPATAATGDCKEYEWQARAYMRLWNVDSAKIAYCMVDTPDDLIGYEQEDIHIVSHIDPVLRITRVPYVRDLAQEARIVRKCEAAQQFVDDTVQRIINEHRGI